MGAARHSFPDVRQATASPAIASASLAVALVWPVRSVGVVLAPPSASARPTPGGGGDSAALPRPAGRLAACDFDESCGVAPEAPVTNCAKVVVPMDWRHPDDHPDITLAIAYSRATGTRKGLFTSNPGGPGADGLDFTSFAGARQASMFTDYDLLGFDPRGFGYSENVRCFTTERQAGRAAGRGRPPGAQQEDPRGRGGQCQALGEACSSTEFSQFVSTQQTVYDLEFLRRYLGRDKPDYAKLNYIGYSYGTWLGAWYADTYPDHVGRFILDSNMNWTARCTPTSSPTRSPSSGAGTRCSIPGWRGTTRPTGWAAPPRRWRRSYERIRTNLLRAYRRGDFVYSVAEADDLIAGQILRQLAVPGGRPHLASTASRSARARISRPLLRRLDATASGPPGRRRLGRGPAPGANRGRQADDDEPVEVDGAEVVRCNDSAYSRDLTKILKRADADAKKYPFVGYTNTVAMCNYWKFAPDHPDHRSGRRAADVDVRVRGGSGDRVRGGTGRAQEDRGPHPAGLGGQRGPARLYIDGPSPCVERIGDEFLFSGVLPAEDKVCSTTPLPRDKRVYALKGPLNGKSYRWMSAAVLGAPGSPNAVVRRDARARARPWPRRLTSRPIDFSLPPPWRR